ncbi:hypothetical protein CQZ98_17385 [Pseudomonas sp. MYb115]|nr:hypothetical protein CQZ98_17385 [Pseudomonas sp. MYb115]
MLIDFAFGGSDFPTKCDDVIKNVGHIEISIEFLFEKIHSFVRNTETPDTVYYVNENRPLSIREFTSFLKEKYLSKLNEISFRDCVSGFFRIYQRNNYNHKRPLDIASREKWEAVRKRLLKMFNRYWTIAQLEDQRTIAQKKSKDISGTFNSGAVKKLTKPQLLKTDAVLLELSEEINSIKEALKRNVTDIKSIINERNLELKNEKDKLVEIKSNLQIQLNRIESNLANGKIRNSKSFQTVQTFFPEIDSEKLLEVESFHKGITNILKKQLKEEQSVLIEAISSAKADIEKVDAELLKIVDSKEDAVNLLERLIELDRLQNDINQQKLYWTLNTESLAEIKALKQTINSELITSLLAIESSLNIGMKEVIELIYSKDSITPAISFSTTDYKFDHGDDRGTGKGFANMIALDITFLNETALPALIHDSLLFKNMDTPAIERLVSIYKKSSKQIFISIDEITKYSKETQSTLSTSMFIKLDKDRLAFNNKWKTKTSDS